MIVLRDIKTGSVRSPTLSSLGLVLSCNNRAGCRYRQLLAPSFTIISGGSLAGSQFNRNSCKAGRESGPGTNRAGKERAAGVIHPLWYTNSRARQPSDAREKERTEKVLTWQLAAQLSQAGLPGWGPSTGGSGWGRATSSPALRAWRWARMPAGPSAPSTRWSGQSGTRWEIFLCLSSHTAGQFSWHLLLAYKTWSIWYKHKQ